jgi:hypothetical protein
MLVHVLDHGPRLRLEHVRRVGAQQRVIERLLDGLADAGRAWAVIRANPP